MHQRILLAFFLFLTINAFSQPIVEKGNRKISGKVIDLSSKQVIEYATIALIDNQSKKTVNGAITNKEGVFILSKIKPGNYTITIQFIGYSDFSKQINLEKDIVLNDVLLKKSTNTLSDVTVTNTRQPIENKIDKLVYNVEKDITSLGGVATDVLKKIPQITVDVDGNVELLGNPNIRFLIDGKPSSIFGSSVADALQSIPNSQIQSIEVITSPSAKYDASGSGGIINIILKKNKMQGFNGNISTSIGTRLENGSININWRHNNFGMNAYAGGNAQIAAETPSGMDRLASSTTGTSRLLQESSTMFSRNSYKSGIGFDWSVTKNDNVTASVGYNHFSNNNHGLTNQTSIQYDLFGTTISNINSNRDFTNKFYVNSFENSLSYKRKFKKENHELEFEYSGSFDGNNTFYDQLQYYQNTSNAFAGAHSLNPGKENEVNLSLNYVQPISDKLFIETGFKTVFESILSNANVFILNASTGNYAIDSFQSYQSDYRRTIYAGYAIANFSLFKFLDIKAGARYEYTVSKATYSNASNTSIPDYHNLAPSFVVSHSFENKQTLKLGYSYRIERPDYRDLNPFMNLSDPHNIVTGNPNLQPEIGNNFEFGYNKSFENGSNINVVLFYQHNSPDIKPYITYYPTYKIGDSVYTDVTVTSRANISSEVKAGANIALSLLVNKRLTIRPMIMVFNRSMKNFYEEPNTLNCFGLRTNINATYTFNKQWIAEAFGNYNLGMKWQGQQPSMYSYTIAARKQLFNNKGSIGFVFVNVFNRYIHLETLSQAKNLQTNSYRDMPYRSFGISFTYKFGKLKFSKPKESDNYLYTPPSEN